MAISNGVVETEDNKGSTVAYSGTATTSIANIPSSADKIISGFALKNGLSDVQLSFDGGTTYFTVDRRGFFSTNIKGEITQVKIKTASGTSAYEALVQFEA